LFKLSLIKLKKVGILINFAYVKYLVKKANTQWQHTVQLPQSSPSSVSSSESVSPGHYASDLNNSKVTGSTGMLKLI